MGVTNNKPSENITIRPTRVASGKQSFHMVGMGSRKRIRSVVNLMPNYTFGLEVIQWKSERTGHMGLVLGKRGLSSPPHSRSTQDPGTCLLPPVPIACVLAYTEGDTRKSLEFPVRAESITGRYLVADIRVPGGF